MEMQAEEQVDRKTRGRASSALRGGWRLRRRGEERQRELGQRGVQPLEGPGLCETGVRRWRQEAWRSGREKCGGKSRGIAQQSSTSHGCSDACAH